MIDKTIFAVLVAMVAAIAVEISKAFLKQVKLPLAGPEMEILRAANDDGLLLILRAGPFGEWVRSGRRDFFEKDNPSYQAKYVEALMSLVQRGLARQEERDVYKLTDPAFSRRKSLGR